MIEWLVPFSPIGLMKSVLADFQMCQATGLMVMLARSDHQATLVTLAPQGYSHAEAATLTTAGLTAWRAPGGKWSSQIRVRRFLYRAQAVYLSLLCRSLKQRGARVETIIVLMRNYKGSLL